MKIHILSLAVSDLKTGSDFYERQQAGLGTYFLDTLFSDIEALLLHAALHARYFGYFAPYPSGFRMRTITRSTGMASKSGGYWIADKIQRERNRL